MSKYIGPMMFPTGCDGGFNAEVAQGGDLFSLIGQDVASSKPEAAFYRSWVRGRVTKLDPFGHPFVRIERFSSLQRVRPAWMRGLD